MPLVVDRYALGPLQTDWYVVRTDRSAAEAAVIDPGGDAASLRLELARLGASTAGILVTHGHFDHVGGVADLAEGSGAEVWMTEGERERLERFPESRPSGVAGRAYTPEHLVQRRRDNRGRGDLVRVPLRCPAIRLRTSRTTRTESSSAATSSSPARSAALTCPAPTGTPSSLLSKMWRIASRPETVVHPGPWP